MPNPIAVAAAGLSSDVSYEIGVLIKDAKQPEGLAHPGPTHGGVNYGGRGGYLPDYIQPHYFPQAAVVQFARADELHVLVLLTSEWAELSQLGHYQVELSDDRGMLARPQDAWMNVQSHRDYEARYQTIKNVQTARIHDGAVSRVYNVWAPDESSVSERVYRGRGTIVFRQKDLLRRDTRWLRLTLRSHARTFQFTWYFDSMRT